MRTAILTFLGCIVCLFISISYLRIREENRRISDNVRALSEMVHRNTFEQQKTASVVKMTVREVKASFPELERKLLKEMDIKLKNVVSVSSIETKTNNTFKTYLKDSVILDTIPIQTVSYVDRFLDFQADIIQGEFIVNRNISSDSLTIVAHRKRQPGFWGFFKKRKLVQTIKGENPNSKYKYNEVISIVR